MKRIIFVILLVGTFAQICLAADFSEKRGDHFIIYYTKDVPEEFVDSVIEYSEKYYNDLTQKMGFTRYDYWTWEKRAKIYIFPDQETYLKETKQPVWSSGIAAYDLKTIWTFPRESGFFDSLLPHEIGHIVLREVIGSKAVPLWFEEGVASYLEQAKRFGAEKIVLDAMKSQTFIPLKDLSQIGPSELRQGNDVSLFYAESVDIVNYLIDKFGVDKFNELCKKIKDGKSFDDALSFAYFDIRSSSQLAEFWEKYLKDKLRSRDEAIF